MCGIAGIVGLARADAEASLRAMVCAQTHRGPDDEGLWFGGAGGVGVGGR